jgi:ApaG protein
MTNAINVSVKTRYLEKESKPEDGKYVYAYEIDIQNNGEIAAQLISRHWKIVDSHEDTQEVQGLGVVGQQPTLQPGENYTYTSGVVLKTSSGYMHGAYTLRDANGLEFEAEIPAFSLVIPSALH